MFHSSVGITTCFKHVKLVISIDKYHTWWFFGFDSWIEISYLENMHMYNH